MSILLMAALLSAAEPIAPVEIDYAPGELAFQALIVGDLGLAERQLRASKTANQNDTAWQLNYAQFLARSGRVNEASAVLRRVVVAPDSEIILASGEVTGTRDASRRALQQLRSGRLSAR